MRSEQPFAYELPFNTSSQLLMLDHAELLAKITKQKQAAEQTAIISRKKDFTADENGIKLFLFLLFLISI